MFISAEFTNWPPYCQEWCRMSEGAKILSYLQISKLPYNCLWMLLEDMRLLVRDKELSYSWKKTVAGAFC